MPHPSYPPWLDPLTNYTWQRVQVTSSSLCSFLQPPVTSSLFNPNILCYSLNIRYQVSHPYRTTWKIIVFWTLNSLWLIFIYTILSFTDSWPTLLYMKTHPQQWDKLLLHQTKI
jgi:hypothetical protein